MSQLSQLVSILDLFCNCRYLNKLSGARSRLRKSVGLDGHTLSRHLLFVHWALQLRGKHPLKIFFDGRLVVDLSPDKYGHFCLSNQPLEDA